MSFLKRFQVSLESLHQLPVDASYVVAYSGGLDSHVLLHCCSKLKLPVRAVHVHHGLQSIADEWVEHCAQICETLDVQLDVVYVKAHKKRGQSPEEAARYARYRALKENMQGNDCLLTAQHLNDQAETFLIQLFRTASSAGLSAMPPCRKLGNYIHLRPLLSFSRKEIEAFARDNDLHWIEDPSNQDVSFDRNYIRNKLVPELENRWPNITQQLSTVADLQSSNLQVQEDMAAIDLANSVRTLHCQTYTRVFTSLYDVVSVLSISTLKQLSSARLLNLLRYWLLQTSLAASTDSPIEKVSPTRKLLEEIERALIYSQSDASPVIAYVGYELRKYQDALYLLKPPKYKASQKELEWKPSRPLKLPTLNVQLNAINTQGKGLKQELRNRPLKICFRQGGEKFHPAGRQHSQRLKKLFQEANILPWERDSIPLLYFEDELIAVVGLWISRHHSVNKNEQGWMISVEKL